MDWIPHIFHQIWLWGKALPDNFVKYQQTWLSLHPHWKLKMWNEENIGTLENINFDDLKLCKNYSEKSDYLRFLIIKNYWGVYLDTDFECLKPIDALVDNCNFFIAPDSMYLASWIFWATKNHIVINKIFLSLHERLLQTELDSVHKIWPWFINCFKNDILKGGWTIFPKEYFYAFNSVSAREKHRNIQPNNFAIHYYSFSWSKKWQIKIKLLKFWFFRQFFKHIYNPIRDFVKSKL